ncbi:MAG TPA: hypothetical protein VFA86_05205 [Gammaproteobacteria bacterium]|nr:hypothetical protein [Gammaproteobacteria bacterium]
MILRDVANLAPMRRATALLLAGTAIALLVSCSPGEIELTQMANTTGSHTPLTSHRYKPTDPKNVRIYARPPAGTYKVIARVESSAHVANRIEAGEQEAMLYKRLRIEAAKAGADGVIDVHAHRSAIFPSPRVSSYDVILTGKAVRLTGESDR